MFSISPRGLRPDGLKIFAYTSRLSGVALSFKSFSFTNVYRYSRSPSIVISFSSKSVIGICQYLLFRLLFLFLFSRLFVNGVCSIYKYNHLIAAVQCQHPSLKIGWISARQNFGRAARAGKVLDGFYKGVSFFLGLLIGRGREQEFLNDIVEMFAFSWHS
jgi:hypothetical protein